MTERVFREIETTQVDDNVFDLIGNQWMLVTAGVQTDFNTMTASWGGLGHLWNRDVAFIVVRPQRYTFEYVEAHAYFTLSFFEPQHRDILQFCGTHSGRDVDKIARTGLTPAVGPTGSVYFEEARMVMECRKLYAQDLEGSAFVHTDIPKEVYAAGDFHRLYVGEILRVLER